MRHEMAIELEEHEVREVIKRKVLADGLERPWDLLTVYTRTMYPEYVEDFNLLQGDYIWPEKWSVQRRAVMLFACNSEFQLEQYLKFLRGEIPAPVHVMDKVCNWVAGITVEVKKEEKA